MSRFLRFLLYNNIRSSMEQREKVIRQIFGDHRKVEALIFRFVVKFNHETNFSAFLHTIAIFNISEKKGKLTHQCFLKVGAPNSVKWAQIFFFFFTHKTIISKCSNINESHCTAQSYTLQSFDERGFFFKKDIYHLATASVDKKLETLKCPPLRNLCDHALKRSDPFPRF